MEIAYFPVCKNDEIPITIKKKNWAIFPSFLLSFCTTTVLWDPYIYIFLHLLLYNIVLTSINFAIEQSGAKICFCSKDQPNIHLS